MKDKYLPIVKSIIAQEKWRQKQIATYYGTGRPLYKNCEDRIDQPIIPNKSILENTHPYLRKNKNYKLLNQESK